MLVWPPSGSTLKRAVLGSAFLIIAAAEPDQSHMIFGMELGKPVSIAPCPRKVLANGMASDFLFDTTDPAEICFEPDIQLRDAPWRRGAFSFPLKRVPLIMSGNTGLTLILDGKLEGIQIDTLGYSHAEGIVRELSAKYGKPLHVDPTQSTVSGIPVPSIEAVWQVRGVFVRYLSVDGSVETGSLWVESTKMHSVRAEWTRKQARAREPL
ncbi:MAG: hypothetical protein V4808_08355 [Pseudomonadota bacterium]